MPPRTARVGAVASHGCCSKAATSEGTCTHLQCAAHSADAQYSALPRTRRDARALGTAVASRCCVHAIRAVHPSSTVRRPPSGTGVSSRVLQLCTTVTHPLMYPSRARRRPSPPPVQCGSSASKLQRPPRLSVASPVARGEDCARRVRATQVLFARRRRDAKPAEWRTLSADVELEGGRSSSSYLAGPGRRLSADATPSSWSSTCSLCLCPCRLSDSIPVDGAGAVTPSSTRPGTSLC
ncbi:hypothetical protein C8Q80DRAFT_1173739 [Daedaleopsis nitida]|nr:hypothetical protein C8Q80DRAFT_1173739 [Daedaleopsis nitida]